MPSPTHYILFEGEKHRILNKNPETQTIEIENNQKRQKILEEHYIDLRNFNKIETQLLEGLAQKHMKLAEKMAEYIQKDGPDYKDVAKALEIEIKQENIDRLVNAAQREFFNNREIYGVKEIFEKSDKEVKN